MGRQGASRLLDALRDTIRVGCRGPGLRGRGRGAGPMIRACVQEMKAPGHDGPVRPQALLAAVVAVTSAPARRLPPAIHHAPSPSGRPLTARVHQDPSGMFREPGRQHDAAELWGLLCERLHEAGATGVPQRAGVAPTTRHETVGDGSTAPPRGPGVLYIPPPLVPPPASWG